MVVDSEIILKALLEMDPVAREEWERDRKLKNDPCIMPFGPKLRELSIDELLYRNY